MNLWFLRMARWARHPPSARQVKAMIVVVLICVVIAGIEAFGLWPDWATAQRMPFGGPFR